MILLSASPANLKFHVQHVHSTQVVVHWATETVEIETRNEKLKFHNIKFWRENVQKQLTPKIVRKVFGEWSKLPKCLK